MRRVVYVALLAVVTGVVITATEQPVNSMEMSAEVAGATLHESPVAKPEPATVTLPDGVYTWIETVTKAGATAKPEDQSAFALAFTGEQVIVATDCNRGVSTYDANEEGLFSFGIPALTKRVCVNSQESEYLKMLADVRSYHLSDDGVLTFELRGGAGTMRFE